MTLACCFSGASKCCCVPQVLLGNFAVLQTVDAGFFGQGIYLTTDPEYAIEEYGRGVFGLARVPLLVCVVVVGNYLPVTPLPAPTRPECRVLTWSCVAGR